MTSQDITEEVQLAAVADVSIPGSFDAFYRSEFPRMVNIACALFGSRLAAEDLAQDTQFTNSFGAPRSGGRSHGGTDMIAPWDEPIYAVESGTVITANHGLGEKHIWLTANNGTAYYYAHLNTFNAAGTSPHVHLQIHPGGRSGAAITPYNTMAAVCF